MDVVRPVRLYTSTPVITGSISGVGRPSDILLDPFEIEIAMVRRQPDEPWTRARRQGRLVSDPTVDTVLVNRHLIREILQVDTPDVQNTGAILARRQSVAPA